MRDIERDFAFLDTVENPVKKMYTIINICRVMLDEELDFTKDEAYWFAYGYFDMLSFVIDVDRWDRIYKYLEHMKTAIEKIAGREEEVMGMMEIYRDRMPEIAWDLITEEAYFIDPDEDRMTVWEMIEIKVSRLIVCASRAGGARQSPPEASGDR